ncbi:hypothetical protein LJB98_03950 [Bacteroidales bacterium OttesenSCG-928-M11]|nr:hypothetical protein [Bacteroidales bacterium OttesenSCG-928-M11]
MVYTVGKATVTFDDGTSVEKMIKVPADAIAILTGEPNYPDAWYLFTDIIDPDTHRQKTLKSLKVENTLGESHYLDVDNIAVLFRSATADAMFSYKLSGSTQQARQNVHTLEQTIYVNDATTAALTTSTKSFYYYRWYTMDNGLETYPEKLTSLTGGTSNEVILDNGLMYASTTKSVLGTNAYEMNYKTDELISEVDDFFNSPGATIYCDLSNYTDFTLTLPSSGMGSMREPTVSLRNIFHIRPASEIAEAIEGKQYTTKPYSQYLANIANKEDDSPENYIYEYYDVEAAVGTRLRLTPQYKVNNYYRKTTTNTYDVSTRFRWYEIDNPNTVATASQFNAAEEGSQGTHLSGNTPPTGYSFPSSTSTTGTYKYMQINTASTTLNIKAGDVKYYAVDVTGSGSSDRKRIAIFKVTFRDQSKVGPIILDPKEHDLFEEIDNKKLIISRTFDQTDTPPNPIPSPSLGKKQPYSVYGMGVQALDTDESTYGFASPLHFTSNGSNTGTHGHHRVPYWSEYGFPQAINSGVTPWSSWSTTRNVKDITYIKSGGINTSSTIDYNYEVGNMLYVDASEVPGVFAALNFNESFCAGATLYFSTWVVNLNGSSASDFPESGTVRPNLVMVLKVIDEDGKETVVKRFYTGDIGYNNVGVWYQVGFEFVIPSGISGNNLDFRLEIQNNGLGTQGNDFALDDICVWRTNPAISAVRTNEVFCMPEGEELQIEEPLEMAVEVNLSQLWPKDEQMEANENLYFRFLDGRSENREFPRYQQGKSKYDNLPENTDMDGTWTNMYVNNGYYPERNPEAGGTQPDVQYWYGRINWKSFDSKTPQTGDNAIPKGEGTGKNNVWYSTDPIYKGMYYYEETGTNDLILAFSQLIPASVLNDGYSGSDFNTGTYHIFVGESSGAILSPECAGEADFRIKFDATDFELTAGETILEGEGSLSICTNNAVDVKAYATDPADEEVKLFAFYDWYHGPLNTQPKTTAGEDTYDARSYTYTIKGNYGTAAGGTLFKDLDGNPIKDLEGAPIRNADGFNAWLKDDSPEGGAKWLVTEGLNDNKVELDGPSWAWGQPNYVGFNQYGGYFRYTVDADGFTSATRIADVDNKDTGSGVGATNPAKPVDFRLLKKDLRAYRFFYPYLADLAKFEANSKGKEFRFPVDYRSVSDGGPGIVASIDYKTGDYFYSGGAQIPDDETVNDYRFTADSYKNWDNAEYMTDYLGNYVNASGQVIAKISSKNGKIIYIDPSTKEKIEFSDLENLLKGYNYKDGNENIIYIPGQGVPYIQDITDLRKLLARIHQYMVRGFIELYKDKVDEDIASLANNYLTVIPTNVAFEVADVNVSPEDLDISKPMAICTTASQISLRAKAWSPDSWYGTVTNSGKPVMPYFEIDDSEFVKLDENNGYVYTVRLPERDLKGNLVTSRFIIPMLYFDEIRTARVKLVDVLDASGKSILENQESPAATPAEDTFSTTGSAAIRRIANFSVLEHAYIGLVDPNNSNKLAEDIVIPITHYYDREADKREEITNPEEKTMNVRWKLNEERGKFFALESYPFIQNGYNYFFDDPVKNEVSEEGDPLPLHTEKTPVLIADSYPVTNNNIAIEIMAMDRILYPYTNHVENENGEESYFIPGYTYQFAFEATGGTSWGDETSHDCDLVMEFRLKVEPDVVIWGGTEQNSEWNYDGNWYIPLKDSNGKYTDQPSVYKAFPPLPQTKVIIPAGSTLYPTLDEYSYLKAKLQIDQDEVEETGYNTSRQIISMEAVKNGFDPEMYVQLSPSEIRTTPWIEFDYNYRPNSCNVIYFKHASGTQSGELGRQDLLNYQEANVDLTVNTVRWYGISAPLKNLYAGDYMFKQANPLTEIRYYNTGSSSQEVPSVGGTGLTNWAEPVNTTTIELKAGEGYALSVGSLYFKALPTDGFANYTDYVTAVKNNSEEWYSVAFSFPQTTTTFNFYHEILKRPMDHTETITDENGRKYRHRFVYEEELGKNEYKDEYGRTVISTVPAEDPIVSIPVKTGGTLTGKDSESYMVVGNPFMSHLDFEAFYKENYQLIEPGYKILQGSITGDEGYFSIMGKDTGKDGTISDPISTEENGSLTLRSIPPMQTFIVTLKSGASDSDKLKINRDMGVVDKDNSILQSPTLNRNLLRLSVSDQNESRTSAVVKVSENSFDEYNSSEDSRLVLIEDVTSVSHIFTIVDGNYLDINRLGELPSTLPIGVLQGSKGKSTLSISGFDTFSGYTFYFIDADKDRKIPLEGDSFEYEFDYDGSSSIGRFYLVTEDVNQIKDLYSDLSVYSQRGMINILALDGSPITEVSIYNVEGHLLYKSVDTGKSRLSIPQPGSSAVMIVKASTSSSSIVTKVINK